MCRPKKMYDLRCIIYIPLPAKEQLTVFHRWVFPDSDITVTFSGILNCGCIRPCSPCNLVLLNHCSNTGLNDWVLPNKMHFLMDTREPCSRGSLLMRAVKTRLCGL